MFYFYFSDLVHVTYLPATDKMHTHLMLFHSAAYRPTMIYTPVICLECYSS